MWATYRTVLPLKSRRSDLGPSRPQRCVPQALLEERRAQPMLLSRYGSTASGRYGHEWRGTTSPTSEVLTLSLESFGGMVRSPVNHGRAIRCRREAPSHLLGHAQGRQRVGSFALQPDVGVCFQQRVLHGFQPPSTFRDDVGKRCRRLHYR